MKQGEKTRQKAPRNNPTIKYLFRFKGLQEAKISRTKEVQMSSGNRGGFPRNLNATQGESTGP